MMLCMFVGASVAQTVKLSDYINQPNTVFKLKCKKSELYLSVEAENSTTGLQIKNAADEDKQDFFIIPTGSTEGDYVWIQSAATGNFVQKVGSWDSKVSGSASPFKVEEVAEGEYKFYNRSGMAGYLGPNKNDTGDGKVIYSNHTADNDNAIWTLELSSVEETVLNSAVAKRENMKILWSQFPETQAFKLKSKEDSQYYFSVVESNSNTGIKLQKATEGNGQIFYLRTAYDNDGFFVQCANSEFISTVSPWFATASANATAFYIENPEDGVIRLKGEEGYLGFDNAQDNEVIYSDKSNGAKSQWVLELATVDNATKQNVISAFDAYRPTYLNEVVTPKWKNQESVVLGYVGGYPESSRAEFEAIQTYEAKEAYVSKYNASRVVLQVGGYYRLVCVAPKAGNGETSYNTLTFNGNGNLVTAPKSSSNVNQIFTFEDAGNGKYYLKNANADKYLNKIAAGGYRSEVVELGQACKIDLRAYDALAQYNLKNADSDNNQHCLFAENHSGEAVPYACAGWNNGANSASAWYLIPATELEVEVANAFGSIYLPFDVTLADGQKAYAVTATSETSATLTEKEDIPAGEGAILAQGTYTLNIAEATSDWTDNKLEGTNVNTYIEGPAYVLGLVGGEVALAKAKLNKDANGAEGTTHFLNNANKAYLPASSGASLALRFNFGGNTTAIESVVNGLDVNAPIYDLSGRRVNAATKGIYIQNGKKFIVK